MSYNQRKSKICFPLLKVASEGGTQMIANQIQCIEWNLSAILTNV